MDKGKGLARRWAVDLHDASSSAASSAVPDPPGFTRSAPDAVSPATPLAPTGFPLAWVHGAGIHMVPLPRRTTPPARASGRTPRPHGRRR